MRLLGLSLLTVVTILLSMLLGVSKNSGHASVGINNVYADAPAHHGNNWDSGTQCESGDGDAGSSCCY